MFFEAPKEKKEVHFATLMEICHLKNAELKPKHHKGKGRVVLRGDIVKDDSGAFGIHSASAASKMTAAKVMDVIARLPRCAGPAADAVSAYTQKKRRKLQGFFKFQSHNVHINGYVFHHMSGPNLGQPLKTLWFFSRDSSKKFCW